MIVVENNIIIIKIIMPPVKKRDGPLVPFQPGKIHGTIHRE